MSLMYVCSLAEQRMLVFSLRFQVLTPTRSARAGPLYGDWQAFIKQHQAAAQNLQHQRTLPSLSGGNGGVGSPMAAAGTRHGGRPTQSAGGGSGHALGDGNAGRSAFDAASGLRTFSGGFQPYNRAAAAQHSAPADCSLKRSISSGRMDGAPCPTACSRRVQTWLGQVAHGGGDAQNPCDKTSI